MFAKSNSHFSSLPASTLSLGESRAGMVNIEPTALAAGGLKVTVVLARPEASAFGSHQTTDAPDWRMTMQYDPSERVRQ